MSEKFTLYYSSYCIFCRKFIQLLYDYDILDKIDDFFNIDERFLADDEITSVPAMKIEKPSVKSSSPCFYNCAESFEWLNYHIQNLDQVRGDMKKNNKINLKYLQQPKSSSPKSKKPQSDGEYDMIETFFKPEKKNNTGGLPTGMDDDVDEVLNFGEEPSSMIMDHSIMEKYNDEETIDERLARLQSERS